MDTLKLDWPSDSRIAVVTLNRPDALNAMNTLTIQELLNLFRETDPQRGASMRGYHGGAEPELFRREVTSKSATA
jgi:enoyl-CoA hydratase/carnithine racemase